MVWTPPAPQASHLATRPPLWSMRRTALAVVAAVTVGALTAVGVSYADAGSSTGPRGGFGGHGLGGGGRSFGGGGRSGQGVGGFPGGSSGGIPGGQLGGTAPQAGQLGGVH